MASIIKANQLQDFGGNSILTSDGAGVVTPNASGIKNTPAFHVNSASTSLSNNTHTTILYPTVDRDTASLYNTSTGKFTVTDSTTGYYYFYAAMGTAVITAARIQINFMKNGTDSGDRKLTCETQSDSSGYPSPNVVGVIPMLTSGDFVMVQGYQNSGGTIALSGELNKNFFGAYKLIGA